MKIRIFLARFLLSLGDFIKTLPIVVMKPDDLVEFSRRSYARPGDIEGLSEDALIESGLLPNEIDLIKVIPKHSRELLLLGVGGGREAVSFAKMGFAVTGLDYVPAMVEQSLQNAEKRGLHIKGFVQEISELDVPDDAFDVIWISTAMYSCIPTRARRVKTVKRINKALKPGGIFICQFHCDNKKNNQGKGEKIRKIIAKSPFGNAKYENGDILWFNLEFLHIFTSEEEIRSELEEGGLMVSKIQFDPTSTRGSAVCVKSTAKQN